MKDLKSSDTWMVFKIMGEFVEGFETLRTLGPAVSVFGGSRFTEDSPYYTLGVEVGRKLAKAGFAVITGGGPGIMEAGCKGAAGEGGEAVGLNIKLPFEQDANTFSTIKVDFDYFFARKVMFMRYAQAYVVLPGGFGTMDEFFEALTLIQTNKIRNFPVVLVGSDFWGGLLDWMGDRMVALGTISSDDRHIYSVVDTADEVLEVVQQGVSRAAAEAEEEARAGSVNGAPAR